MVEGIPPDQVNPSRMVSVLGLKLDHDQNEFLFNLDEKFQNYDANAVQITRRDVVSLSSQIFNTQGFVSPYVMQYKKLLPMLWHNNTTWDENLIGKTTVVDGEEVIVQVQVQFIPRAGYTQYNQRSFSHYIRDAQDRINVF